MGKLKTNKGVKKRFRVTPSGKVMHAKSGKRHLLGHKSRSRKRSLRLKGQISITRDAASVRRMIPFAN